MEKTVISCNVCSRMKQEANHWFVAITPKDASEKRRGIAFGPSEVVIDEEDDSLILEDICGQECLHKRLSRWIESLNPTTKAPNQENEAL
jgi:hypothetical protein